MHFLKNKNVNSPCLIVILSKIEKEYDLIVKILRNKKKIIIHKYKVYRLKKKAQNFLLIDGKIYFKDNTFFNNIN